MTPSTGKPDTSEPSPQQEQPLSTRVRVIQLILLTVAVGITLGMAYWQFTRWDSTNSWQNLGYAFQWPAFGIFFIWAYRKYMEYERERLAGNIDAAYVVPEGTMVEIPEDFLPESAAATTETPTERDDRRSARREGREGSAETDNPGNSDPTASDN